MVQFVTKKPWTVSDNSVIAKGLEELFKKLGKKGLNVSKKKKIG